VLLGWVSVFGASLPVTDVLKKNGILVLPLRENFRKTKSPLANQKSSVGRKRTTRVSADDVTAPFPCETRKNRGMFMLFCYSDVY
jgi:hypothetical protein